MLCPQMNKINGISAPLVSAANESPRVCNAGSEGTSSILASLEKSRKGDGC